MADEKLAPEVQSHEDPPTAQVPNAQLRDKRKLPEGVVPKQAQGYVVAGLAVLILMAVMFSKNRPQPAEKTAPAASSTLSTDANQRKIQELEQDLSAQQRQAAAQRASASTPPTGTTPTMNSAQLGVPAPASPLPPPVAAQASEPPRDPIADAEKEMAFKARFASNLVGSHDGAARSSGVDAARSASLPPAPAPQNASTPSSTNNKRPLEVNVNSAHGQPFVVFEGTTIDTVLVNRLDGEFSGPVKVMVTNPVYSQDRQHMLVPEGTFILGDVQKVSSLGQKRLAVTFHRMLMPDGYSVDLDQFHGLDQAGATGIKDKVNNHYMEIFGASIALGVISGAAEASNANQGYNQSGSEAYKAGIASNLSQSGANVLDRFINIPPTITIREGHRIKVYITQDMLLPGYENHDMSEVF
ncbi:TrbI/VirB10 family protein [Edaphobacter flagellatus]|uniref:TrbI/VirB10 family protein n=1 Tax=Edaphobacter flagellatus TaxID=1933044 RepID=UPI0021B3DC4C|nr:TrbI/VirB10 family protein [Edaphobacter flagellatus]